MPKRSSKPKDVNRLAALIVESATNEEEKPGKKEKNPAAVALGKLGGKKGGPARAERLTAEARHTIAVKAAKARWRGQKD